MNRLWSRVGIRVASVGLLVAGVIGGVYLGQDQQVQAQSAPAPAFVVQSDDQLDVQEMQFLKERHNRHAAARAYQRQAEDVAATEAAAEAKVAAGKARAAEAKLIAKKVAAEKKAAAEAKKAESASTGGGTVFSGDIPASCDEYNGNRAIGCAMMLKSFSIDQFPCLDKLWKRESGWNINAHNSSSGAHGIPQALPGSKMASAGSDWRTNAATQIEWGLGYIKGRYNSPCNAWAHSESSGWY